MGLLTATEAARRLGKSDKTVRAWINQGKLTAVHISATQLGIREEDLIRVAAHMGIDLEEDRPGRPGDNATLQERIRQLEQEVAALRSEVERLKERPVDSEQVHSRSIPAPVRTALTRGPVEQLPAGSALLRTFAQDHSVNPATARDHAVIGLGGDYLVLSERPKQNRPKEVERFLTPAQQTAAIAYWQRHGVTYTSCSACPHDLGEQE
jgi:excisionase family DNA binding protein